MCVMTTSSPGHNLKKVWSTFILLLKTGKKVNIKLQPYEFPYVHVKNWGTCNVETFLEIFTAEKMNNSKIYWWFLI